MCRCQRTRARGGAGRAPLYFRGGPARVEKLLARLLGSLARAPERRALTFNGRQNWAARCGRLGPKAARALPPGASTWWARPGRWPRPKAALLLRKEVIQPQVPLRLPCYDFIPVTAHTFEPCPPLLQAGWRSSASGTSDSHDVTGGVYKARERIHGAVADAPLLAIPASWRRVAASNPNWAQLWRLPPPRGLGLRLCWAL